MPVFEIDNVLVSLDVAERYFCCDLEKCLGACCIDGDDGAPVTDAEAEKIKGLLPVIESELTTSAMKVIDEKGITYRDCDNDLVIQTVENANCVFTAMEPGGKCLCAIERLCGQGRTGGFAKPSSCALYPIRLTTLSNGLVAMNYDRRKLCRPAEKKGRELGVRVYQFLERPLTNYFGKEWYEALKETCDQWNSGKLTS